MNFALPRIGDRLPIIELRHNGDPYGSGFVASQSDDGGASWHYRGDIGAQSRRYWRNYARRNNFILRMAE